MKFPYLNALNHFRDASTRGQIERILLAYLLFIPKSPFSRFSLLDVHNNPTRFTDQQPRFCRLFFITSQLKLPPSNSSDFPPLWLRMDCVASTVPKSDVSPDLPHAKCFVRVSSLFRIFHGPPFALPFLFGLLFPTPSAVYLPLPWWRSLTWSVGRTHARRRSSLSPLSPRARRVNGLSAFARYLAPEYFRF